MVGRVRACSPCGAADGSRAGWMNINTSDIVFNPPAELQGKINVVPEMADVMALAIPGLAA